MPTSQATSTTLSTEQQTIVRHVQDGSGNAVVNAVAGAGKTLALISAARSLPKNSRFLCLAFNKHTADTLKVRLGNPAQASTLHAFGLQQVSQLWDGSGGKAVVQSWKYDTLCKRYADPYLRLMPYRERAEQVSAFRQLIDLARHTLTPSNDIGALHALAAHYGLNLPDWMLHNVDHVLRAGAEQARRQRQIDFADMIWLPYHLELPIAVLDYVLVDELQDLTAAQLNLVIQAVGVTGRILGVGDPRQSIMGFGGASTQAFQDAKIKTNATEFGLSTCYRCPTSHLELARTYVPHIQARPNAPAGVLHHASEHDLARFITSSVETLILNRYTAPLIVAWLRLAREGVHATIRGQDIAPTLLRLAEKICNEKSGFNPRTFSQQTATYQDILRRTGRIGDAGNDTYDYCEALCLLVEDMPPYASFRMFEQRLSILFGDERSTIQLSTIHRAKGAESTRVIVLGFDRLPHTRADQLPWQMVQEENLAYVALTRSRSDLILCS